MAYIIGYFAAVNVAAFCMYGVDKQKARRNRWRIPEVTLLLMAVLGGAVGSYVGMRVFHHKTQKAKFYLGVPVIGVAELLMIVYLYGK